MSGQGRPSLITLRKLSFNGSTVSMIIGQPAMLRGLSLIMKRVVAARTPSSSPNRRHGSSDLFAAIGFPERDLADRLLVVLLGVLSGRRTDARNQQGRGQPAVNSHAHDAVSLGRLDVG